MTNGWIVADELEEFVTALFANAGLADAHAKVGREVGRLRSRHFA